MTFLRAALTRREAVAWLAAAGISGAGGTVTARVQALPACIRATAADEGRFSWTLVSTAPISGPSCLGRDERRIPAAGHISRVSFGPFNAAGIYSGVRDGNVTASKQTFPRGYQVTDASGTASQLYFDDRMTDKVHALALYSRRGRRSVRNDDDGLYRHGGSQLALAVNGDSKGLAGTFSTGLQSV